MRGAGSFLTGFLADVLTGFLAGFLAGICFLMAMVGGDEPRSERSVVV
jgi:hypothetical protein